MLALRARGVPARLRRVRVHVVVDVLLHLRLGGEAPPAVGHGAAEGPVALVRPRVLVQDGLLPEVLAALRALVGLLPRVDAQVLVQDRALPEVPAAVHAPVGLLVGVDAQVLGQVRLLPEALAALGARVRPGLDMYAAVLQEGRLLLELFLANGAAHVQGHSCRATVLYYVWEGTLTWLTLLQVLEGAEVGA